MKKVYVSNNPNTEGEIRLYTTTNGDEYHEDKLSLNVIFSPSSLARELHSRLFEYESKGYEIVIIKN